MQLIPLTCFPVFTKYTFICERNTSKSLVLTLETLENEHAANDDDSSHRILFIAIQGTCSHLCADQKNMWVPPPQSLNESPINKDQRQSTQGQDQDGL